MLSSLSSLAETSVATTISETDETQGEEEHDAASSDASPPAVVDSRNDDDDTTTTLPSSSALSSAAATAMNTVRLPRTTDIRHVVSLANYVKHCQQQHETFFGPTPPPTTSSGNETAADETKDASTTSKAKSVHWSSDAPVVHRIPHIPVTDFAAVWFSLQDFERQERDIKLAVFRWENHINGDMTFDSDNNSIRGLEHYFRTVATKAQPSSKRVHRKAVLEEVQRQQQQQTQEGGTSHNNMQWKHEIIRQVSLENSQADLEKCLKVGQDDYEAAVQAWLPPAPAAQTTKSPTLASTKTKKKRRGGLARFFGKKK